MTSKIKLVFFGTPEIAVSSLERLVGDDDFEVLAVVTQADKPFGRKQVLTAPPVKEFALSSGIPVHQPVKLNDADDLYDNLKGLKPDYLVVVAYGQIMSQKWLDLPEIKPVNLHVSLLPKYRGASPMQEALLHGDAETGVTIQEMVFKMDKGPILSAQAFDIAPNDTIYEVHDTSARIGADLLVATLKKDSAGLICPLQQDEASASYCSKISKQDGFVSNQMSVSEIYNKFRAYKAWPGVWTYFSDGIVGASEGKRLKLLELSPTPSDDSFEMQCSDGSIYLTAVQPEGKKQMPAVDFMRGAGLV